MATEMKLVTVDPSKNEELSTSDLDGIAGGVTVAGVAGAIAGTVAVAGSMMTGSNPGEALQNGQTAAAVTSAVVKAAGGLIASVLPQ
jgi:hypothetical protein